LAASGKPPSITSTQDLLQFPLIHVEAVQNKYHPVIALKELKRGELNETDFTEAAQMEADNLKKLRSLNHPHLIKAIAWYTQGGTHYFMFPWANLGNVRDYCEMDRPNLTDSYLHWMFHQFCGLADAISKLHGSDKKASYRHGDLKPDNILCFGDSRSTCIFVITDVGLTRKHNVITEERNSITRTNKGTIKYEPPETETELDQDNQPKPRSRRYDIWSMGCIYLEFIMWLLYGPEGLARFHNDLRSSKGFYEFDSSKKAKLHSVVEVWVEHIKLDRRCPPGTALRHLLDLVINGLLVVRLGDMSTKERTASMGLSNGDASDLAETTQSSGNASDLAKTTQSTDDASNIMFLVTQPTLPIQPENAPLDGRMCAEEMDKEMKKILTMATTNEIVWMKFDEQAQPLPDERLYRDKLRESDAKQPRSPTSQSNNEVRR
jgi:serine/threonine protein kinase